MDTHISKNIINYWKVEASKEREIQKTLVKSESTEDTLKKLINTVLHKGEDESQGISKKLKRNLACRKDLSAFFSDLTEFTRYYLFLIILSSFNAAFGFKITIPSFLEGGFHFHHLLR